MPSDAMISIRWFGASLGELYHQLSGAGVRVPNGFAVTADAYRYFISPSAASR